MSSTAKKPVAEVDKPTAKLLKSERDTQITPKLSTKPTTSDTQNPKVAVAHLPQKSQTKDQSSAAPASNS